MSSTTDQSLATTPSSSSSPLLCSARPDNEVWPQTPAMDNTSTSSATPSTLNFEFIFNSVARDVQGHEHTAIPSSPPSQLHHFLASSSSDAAAADPFGEYQSHYTAGQLSSDESAAELSAYLSEDVSTAFTSPCYSECELFRQSHQCSIDSGTESRHVSPFHLGLENMSDSNYLSSSDGNKDMLEPSLGAAADASTTSYLPAPSMNSPSGVVSRHDQAHMTWSSQFQTDLVKAKSPVRQAKKRRTKRESKTTGSRSGTAEREAEKGALTLGETRQYSIPPEEVLVRMSIIELERQGWSSHWPLTAHHVTGKQRKRKNGGEVSKGCRSSADVNRHFIEIKCPIQIIPASSDPSRFQTNGRCLIACDACKKRKMRCTNENPACANCIRRGTACRYAPAVRTRGRARQLSSSYDLTCSANSSPVSTPLVKDEPLF